MNTSKDWLKIVAVALAICLSVFVFLQISSPKNARAAFTTPGFASPPMSTNLSAPSISLPLATTSGSVSVGTIYFQVTALDGAGGETSASNTVSTTTVTNGVAYNLTWTAIPGAIRYRVNFSTTTPAAFLQYFTATSTSAYNFTSTSTPTFRPSGTPTSNTAYSVFFSGNGHSWVSGGNFGVGTSSPVADFQATASTTAATTTVELGQSGQTKGTCIKLYTDAGTAVYLHATSTNSPALFTTTDCASVGGF